MEENQSQTSFSNIAKFCIRVLVPTSCTIILSSMHIFHTPEMSSNDTLNGTILTQTSVIL